MSVATYVRTSAIITPYVKANAAIMLDLTAAATRVSAKDIRSDSRYANIVRARHIYFYALHRVFGYSMAKIGRLTGHHHTTILHAIRRVEKRPRKFEPELSGIITAYGRGYQFNEYRRQIGEHAMTDKPLVVLALDIAKWRTGWAIGSPGMNRPYWGVYANAQPWEKNEGKRLAAWNEFLEAKIREHRVTYIAMERLIVDMRDFSYDGTVPMAQMHGQALFAAEQAGIKSGGVSIQSWRAHFLGTAQAPKFLAKGDGRTTWLKDAAMKKCAERGWLAQYHDEAEALGIMDFALACLDKDYDQRIGPYVRRAELKAEVARFRGEDAA